MELRHLRYFRAVAESKGFREAARRLHVVQPALSQTVSDLERELGVRLLTRNSRSVRLTSEGEVFLKEAKEILAHADPPSSWLAGQRGERLVQCPWASWAQPPPSSYPASSATTGDASLAFA